MVTYGKDMWVTFEKIFLQNLLWLAWMNPANILEVKTSFRGHPASVAQLLAFYRDSNLWTTDANLEYKSKKEYDQNQHQNTFSAKLSWWKKEQCWGWDKEAVHEHETRHQKETTQCLTVDGVDAAMTESELTLFSS